MKRQLGHFETAIRASTFQVKADSDLLEQPGIEPSNGWSEVAAHESLLLCGRAATRNAMFDDIRALYKANKSVIEIARKLGLGPRRDYQWVRRIDLPERNIIEAKLCNPAYFEAFLARRWADGSTKVRQLSSEIRHHGYTGSFSHVARFLAHWRSKTSESYEKARFSLDEEALAAPRVKTLDPK